MLKKLGSAGVVAIGWIVGVIILICLALYPYVFGNKQLFDTNQKFDYAIIELPNGEIVEGEISKWTDYEDGEQLQVIFENGDTYLTSSFKCTLVDYK